MNTCFFEALTQSGQEDKRSGSKTAMLQPCLANKRIGKQGGAQQQGETGHQRNMWHEQQYARQLPGRSKGMSVAMGRHKGWQKAAGRNHEAGRLQMKANGGRGRACRHQGCGKRERDRTQIGRQEAVRLRCNGSEDGVGHQF